MKNLPNWLNANKFSLKVKKKKKKKEQTETVIFKPKRKKYEAIIKSKLNRRRLHPTNNIKYLGIKVDENLNWKHHVNDISAKSISANAILFKIRNYVNPKLLRSVYFAIIESHLNHSSLVWAQTREE